MAHRETKRTVTLHYSLRDVIALLKRDAKGDIEIAALPNDGKDMALESYSAGQMLKITCERTNFDHGDR